MSVTIVFIVNDEMNLLHDNGYLNDDQFESLSHDMQRILKILTSIVKTMNAKVHPGS